MVPIWRQRVGICGKVSNVIRVWRIAGLSRSFCDSGRDVGGGCEEDAYGAGVGFVVVIAHTPALSMVNGTA